MQHIQSVRRSLLAQVQVHNPILMYSAVKLRLRLMDACPDTNREIDLVMLALKHDTVKEMLRLGKTTPTEILLPKLARWLIKDGDIEEAEASWAVNSWAMALGLISIADDPFVSNEVFNVPTNQPDKIRLEGHTQFITSICFNSQGTLLASSSWDGTVRLWDMNNLPNHRILTPHSPREFKVHEERILRSVAFDASGDLVAAADSDGSIWLWTTHDGAEVAALTGHLRSVNCITFSRDKYLLAGCSLDNTVCLWDLERGQEPIWIRKFDYMPECVAISPDSKLVALATKDTDILILDIVTGATIRVLRGHTVTVRSVAFTPNGRTLISVSGDGTVRLWYVDTGLQTRLLNVTNQAVDYGSVGWDEAALKLSCVAVSPDGELIAAGDFNEKIYLWRVNGEKTVPFMKLHGHAAVVSSVAFSPDGKWLASSSWDQTICLWDIRSIQISERHN